MSGEGRKILLVDDEQPIARVTSRVLERSGYVVTTAHDGQDGLEKYRAAGRTDAVVTDLTMPVMDGVAFSEALRGAGYRGPIIVTSGFYENGIPEGTFDVFLGKPYTPDSLLKALEDAFRNAALQSQPAPPTEPSPGQ